MKILLLLIYITADGLKPAPPIEMPTLKECWARAEAAMSKAPLAELQEAGLNGVGAGCLVIPAPAQETLR